MGGAEPPEGLLLPAEASLSHVTANQERTMPSVSQNNGHAAPGPTLRLPQLVLVEAAERQTVELC